MTAPLDPTAITSSHGWDWSGDDEKCCVRCTTPWPCEPYRLAVDLVQVTAKPTWSGLFGIAPDFGAEQFGIEGAADQPEPEGEEDLCGEMCECYECGERGNHR